MLKQTDDMQTLDRMRFPLALAVVALHLHPEVVAPSTGTYALLSADGLYNIFWILFSHTLPTLAVPAFFLISGYLFFRNMQRWDSQRYKEKLRRRARSLLVPFLSWTLVMLAACLAFRLALALHSGSTFHLSSCLDVSRLPHIFTDYTVYTDSRTDWWGQPMLCAAPYHGVLWFVRDLIFLCLLSPVIWWTVRRIPWVVLLFAALFILGIPFPTLWLTPTGTLFFSLGALFSVREWNVVQTLSRYRWGLFALAFATLLPCLYFDADFTPTGSRFFPWFVIFGTLSLFALPWPSCGKLSTTSFFIYLSHQVYILPLTGIVFQRIVSGTGNHFVLSLVYMGSLAVTVAVCLSLYFLLKKLTPKLLSWLTGGR